MSKFARVLVLGAMLVAVRLPGTSAVAQQQPSADELFRHGERASQQQTSADGLFRQGERASQQEITSDAGPGGVVAYEHRNDLGGTPTRVSSPARPAAPSGQPSLPVGTLGVLAAVLALAGASAAITTRRASRRIRARQAA
jgi:hypothetical protein